VKAFLFLAAFDHDSQINYDEHIAHTQRERERPRDRETESARGDYRLRLRRGVIEHIKLIS
jgi:hypothetical protein